MAAVHKSHAHELLSDFFSDKEKQLIKLRLSKRSKIDYKTGCIEWSGANVLGYGQMRFNGKNYLSHRLSYVVYKGNICVGMCVCHKCDNPKCVNSEHMFLGDHSLNMSDMVRKQRNVNGARVGTSKLTEEHVIEMKKMYQSGMTQNNIAKTFGVGQDTVSRNINSKRWKHLNEIRREYYGC